MTWISSWRWPGRSRRRSGRRASHILSQKVDIANVRLQFPNGCIANLTASRISTERVRKLRLFQPQQYLSLDYTRQDLAIFSVGENRQIGFEQAAVTKSEPLQLQFDAFLDSVKSRNAPKCSGRSRASIPWGRIVDS